MSKIEDDSRPNQHYSVQTGHALRGEHDNVRRTLGGMMPEAISGYSGLETFRKRRYVRRITQTGHK